MTKTFVGAMANLRPTARGSGLGGRSDRNPNAKSQPPTQKLERLKAEVAYWALRTYTRVLKTIGDVSELTANYKQKEDR